MYGQSGSGNGVFGTSAGGGVWGESSGFDGVHGHTSNQDSSNPVSGVAGFGDNNNYGVLGLSQSGTGVAGLGGLYGVYASNPSGDALYAIETANTPAGAAVHAVNTAGGNALIADGSVQINGTSFANGDVNTGSNVSVGGNLFVVGAKDFVEPHPTDASKEIAFTALEGPESGTYFRGSTKISGGMATIQVPESFRLTTSADGLTVQVTPFGEFANLVVVSKNLKQIVVRGKADISFDYFVQGVRAGYEDSRPIRENVHFVPRGLNDDGLAQLPEIKRRLKSNGTLNEDGSTNMDTARRLGWDQLGQWKQQ